MCQNCHIISTYIGLIFMTMIKTLYKKKAFCNDELFKGKPKKTIGQGDIVVFVRWIFALAFQNPLTLFPVRSFSSSAILK